MAARINKHDAKIVLLELTIVAAERWTFNTVEIPPADQEVLRAARDEYIAQLRSNLTHARKAASR